MRKLAVGAMMASGIVGLSFAAVAALGDGANDGGLQGMYDAQEQVVDDNVPQVETLEDGTQVQRTPDPGEGYLFGGQPNAYNTSILDADNRGCESCHTEGLAALLDNMEGYKHWPLDNGLGTVIDAKDCRLCHNEHSYFMFETDHSFGNMIHGIHRKAGVVNDCMACHTATADGKGMRLWEDAKHEVLNGIVKVPDVEGDFSWDQTTLGGNDVAFTFWPHASDDQVYVNAFSDEEPSDEDFNSYEITVSGMVDNPFTITLGDLIDQAPSETTVSTIECVINNPTGESVTTAEITGVPVSWLLEKAGVQDGATRLSSVAADGATYFYNDLESIARDGGWLVYEVNGRRLTWLEGYPCRIWFPRHENYAPMPGRWTNELVVDDGTVGESGGLDEGSGWTGDGGSSYEYANKPNYAICNIHEGQIIEAGKPFTFEGYADGFDEPIAAIEFSMDGGETWTSYSTDGADRNVWVWWRFAFTPEEPGSYVLKMRAVTDEGRYAPVDDEVMVVAK